MEFLFEWKWVGLLSLGMVYLWWCSRLANPVFSFFFWPITFVGQTLFVVGYGIMAAVQILGNLLCGEDGGSS
jgi:hypothetical protein